MIGQNTFYHWSITMCTGLSLVTCIDKLLSKGFASFGNNNSIFIFVNDIKADKIFPLIEISRKLALCPKTKQNNLY